MSFALDPRLEADCHQLGRLEMCRVLLLNNAEVPWFILVPETDVIEICDLSAVDQTQLWAEVDQLARFIRSAYSIDKLNIGAIGNVVSQLHVHVIGRRKDDFCWPDVVWGQQSNAPYEQDSVAATVASLSKSLEGFR